MTHSWKAYDVAQKITDALFEHGFLKEDITDQEILLIRGLIQIRLEYRGSKESANNDG